MIRLRHKGFKRSLLAWEKGRAKVCLIALRFVIANSALMLSVPLIAQVPFATAKVDTTNILVGQQVMLKLQLKAKAGTKVLWPTIADSISQSVEVIEPSAIDTSFSEDKKVVTYSQQLRITSFDTGRQPIPSFLFMQHTPGGDSVTLMAATNQLMLTVSMMAVDTTKAFRDIKGNLGAPLTFRELLPWLSGAVALIIVGISILYLYRRWKKSKPLLPVQKVQLTPPHIVALNALEHLRQEKLWQQGHVKEYHSQLTEIVRIYLENRFGILAMEMPTGEILQEMKYKNLSDGDLTELEEVLHTADMVKFAKGNPLPDRHDTSFRQATTFVRHTVPARHDANGSAAQEINGASALPHNEMNAE